MEGSANANACSGDVPQARDASYRFGPTRFSVIPRVAVGNVSIRFVPDQDADKLIDLLRCEPDLDALVLKAQHRDGDSRVDSTVGITQTLVRHYQSHPWRSARA